MKPSDDPSLARQRALRARGSAIPPEGVPPPVILDSWARCMDVGLMPGAALTVPVVEAADLAQRRGQSELVRRLAQAELETLSRQIAGSNFLLAFADNTGVILDLYADNRFNMSGSGAGIVAGSVWCESVAGTNGLGTALAAGQAVAVTGLEHFYLQLGQISCTAAPVRDAFGRVLGVLDASSYYESRQRHTTALVQMAATHIENGLLAHQMAGQLVLALHPRAEYLGTLSAGLLAFDGLGRLLAISAAARHLLTGLHASPGTRFEELFGEPLEHVLARLHSVGDVRLRDALGSTLNARMVGRPSVFKPVGKPLAVVPKNMAAAATAPRAAPTEADFLASDASVAQACKLVQAAVRMRVPILLQGETGTGKERLARHAHALSQLKSDGSKRQGEFVALNCAAMPAELFEAELFGYAEGAFTGARRQGNPGLLVAADGGTLLLDEIRELPLHLQAALLRFLDDQTVRAVGSQTSRKVDVLVLAASHADLAAEVRAKRFREDLLYRLNTVCVSLPPLRARQDFAQAVRWVLDDMGELGASLQTTEEAINRLRLHSWPGNFRELRSVLTRALLARADKPASAAIEAAEVDALLPACSSDLAPQSVLQRSAAELVRAEFERSGHSVSRTSRSLGISRTTVYRHLRG
jgi:sigma-54 dependent transcriptional regulator, acetoin dehydrogenase operon transcriptional activator AcoR